jgi:hypothetical protein
MNNFGGIYFPSFFRIFYTSYNEGSILYEKGDVEMKFDKNNVIDMETEKGKKDKERFLKKAIKIKEIAKKSALKQMGNPQTAQIAIGVGLYQGLKYGGNLKRGLKGGLAAYGVTVGASVVTNLINNIDFINED